MPKISSLPGSPPCGCPGKSRDKKHLLLPPEWRDMSTDIGEPKIQCFRNQRQLLTPSRICSPLLLPAHSRGCSEDSDGAHSFWFKKLIWLCLKFMGITVNQRAHGWEFEKCFVLLNYMNPKRSLASKAPINPSNFVIVIRDLFLLSVALPKA